MKNKETKKREALERQKDYQSLTIPQKVVKLNLKLGEDKGARKQRTKLGLQLLKETAERVEGQGQQKPAGQKKPYQKPKRS